MRLTTFNCIGAVLMVVQNGHFGTSNYRDRGLVDHINHKNVISWVVVRLVVLLVLVVVILVEQSPGGIFV